MNEPLLIWAKLVLRLALVLLAEGILPLVPVLLSVLVAPIGALCLAIALILFLAAWARLRPGSS